MNAGLAVQYVHMWLCDWWLAVSTTHKDAISGGRRCNLTACGHLTVGGLDVVF